MCQSETKAKWFLNYDSLPSNAKMIEPYDSLFLENINKKNTGIYICYGSYDKSPFSQHFIAKVNLEIYSKYLQMKLW